MDLKEIKRVVKPQVWEALRDGISGYHFNISTDFFIRRIENHLDHFWIELRDRRLVSISRPQDYETFCEGLLKVWNEFGSTLKEDEIFEDEIEEDEHWYCRGCGKEFSHEMHFRKDNFGRIICPYCDHRMMEKMYGERDSFYD